MTGLYLLCALFSSALCSYEIEIEIAAAVHSATEEALRSLPCPEPADIFPCVCTVGTENRMVMNCSAVESEDQLARVFSSNIPFTKFYKLEIEGNRNLKVLRKGDLGPVSFQFIHIEKGVLEEVQYEAFAQSYATAESIDLTLNNVSAFPFEELPLFTSLVNLLLTDNSIPVIPMLQSDSLSYINLVRNLFSEIPVGSFKGLKNISLINLFGNDIDAVLSDTFANLPSLNSVILATNRLSHIPRGTIKFNSTDDGFVNLSTNTISSIAVDAITGLNKGELHLWENSFSVLEEEVFRPLLEGGATIFLQHNPLACDCDMAWLITNPQFMELISSGTTCYNGEHLTDLDPSIFEDLC